MQADLPSAAGLLTATARELVNAELVQYLWRRFSLEVGSSRLPCLSDGLPAPLHL